MRIKPIQKVNVGEQVYEQMKQLLIEGEWAPGEKIPSENELADMFNVSRITVRQALQKLNVLGLLETRFGEGSFVKVVDVGDSMNGLIPVMYLGEQSAQEVFEFRMILETECGRLAARRATDKDIQELKDTLKNMIEYEKNKDLEMFSVADLDFHFKIAKITRNTLVIKTMSILREVLESSMNDVIDKMGCENGIFYHTEILRAIEQKEEIKAANMMKEHIKKNFEYFN